MTRLLPWLAFAIGGIAGGSLVLFFLLNRNPSTDTGFGYGMQLEPNTDYDRALQMVKDAHFQWVKAQVRWEGVEPKQGEIQWQFIDPVIDKATAVLGRRRVLLSVVTAPSWARPPCGQTDCNVPGPPSDPKTLADFLAAIVIRHPGQIGAIEVWNEENLWYEWGGQGKLSATQYTELLRTAYRAIKAADSGVVVVSGAPTPTGVNDGAVAIDDVAYVQQMCRAGAGDSFDVLGAHPGGYNNPPDDTPDRVTTDSAGYKGHLSFYFLRFEDYHQVMKDNGCGEKRIWFTEFGWAVAQGIPPPEAYAYARQLTEQQQAEYLVRAFQIGKAKGYVGKMFVWNLNFAVSPDPNDDLAKRAFSVLYPDWSPRPAYLALQSMQK